MEPNTSPPEAPHHPSFLVKWGSLVVLSLALAIIVIDSTLLNVSISTLIRELNTDIRSIQWVITAYALVLTAFTITGGKLGDIFGRKRMFILGAILFAIGSFTASLSNNFATLLWGESIIEGFGAALMMPATSSLLVANFFGRERAIAFGIWGGIAAASSAIGPILGGFLTSHYSWRWGFRINVAVVAILIIGSVLIKDTSGRNKHIKLDWIGILLSSLGLLGLVFGVIESGTYGWFIATHPFVAFGTEVSFDPYSIVAVSMYLGAVLLLLFVIWENYLEKRAGHPLVSMKLFNNRQFSSGLVTTAVLALGQAGLTFAIPIFLESVRGLDAFNTGLSLLPLSLALLIAAPLSAYLVKFISSKAIIQIGLIFNIIAIIVLYLTMNVDSTALSLAPGLAFYGFGMGFVMAQINNITLSAVDVRQAGEASGLNSTTRQLGMTLGAAIIGAVLLASVTSGLFQGVQDSTVIQDQSKPAIQSALAQQSDSVEFGNGQLSGASKLSPAVTAEIGRIVKQATTTGSRDTLLYACAFAILGFIVSFALPGKWHSPHSEKVAGMALAGH
jgi:EmrB/QacA subfamily drug resistance transporter